MSIRPHRSMKLRGDPRVAAFRILSRFGYRRTARRPVVLVVGWVLFLLGLGILVQCLLSRDAAATRLLETLVAMLAICAVGLVLVGLGRRTGWARGLDGTILRLEGTKRLVLHDDAEDRVLGTWDLPELPPEDTPQSDSPARFAERVRALRDLLAEATGSDPLTGVGEEDRDAIRGWVLLGELAGRLESHGHASWSRGSLLPGRARIALFAGLVAASALAATVHEIALYAGGAYVGFTIATVLTQRTWGRGLTCGALAVTDRVEDGTWILGVRGPAGRLEDGIPLAGALDRSLAAREPERLDALAARVAELAAGP